MKKVLNVSTIVLVVLACLFATVIISCGKKGDPVPKEQIKLPIINNLQGELTKEGVLLSWTLPEKTKKARYIKIFRSTVISGQDCPGCPQKFVLLIEDKEAFFKTDKKEAGQYRYLDRYIDRGRNYGYRVIWCVSSGYCSSESNTSEIKIK